MLQKVLVYADGGSRGNPGPSAIGIVICGENEEILKKHGKFLGRKTNNEAEYLAVIKGLQIASKCCKNELHYFSDSELVINQLNGKFKVKKKHLKKMFEEVKMEEHNFEKVVYGHVNREHKFIKMAHKLAQEKLRKSSIPKRIRA